MRTVQSWDTIKKSRQKSVLLILDDCIGIKTSQDSKNSVGLLFTSGELSRSCQMDDFCCGKKSFQSPARKKLKTKIDGPLKGFYSSSFQEEIKVFCKKVSRTKNAFENLVSDINFCFLNLILLVLKLIICNFFSFFYSNWLFICLFFEMVVILQANCFCKKILGCFIWSRSS